MAGVIPGEVMLREVTSENVRSLCELEVREEQRKYVVSNAIAIAEACYSDNDWVRGIYSGEVAAGLAVVRIGPDPGSFLLWRFMIDARYQRASLGRAAMSLVIAWIRKQPNNGEFLTSVVPGDLSPRGFYHRLGFADTGEWYAGESVMRLAL